MNRIEFFVPGIPRPRRTPRPGVSKTGKVFYRPTDSPDETWKDRVHAAALQARALHGQIEGPVEVTFVFVFPAPKRVKIAHDNEPGVYIVIESAEHIAAMTTTPDLDNLEKTVMDAIQDTVIGNDKLVWKKHSRKVYGRHNR